jgi:hypothetical protein
VGAARQSRRPRDARIEQGSGLDGIERDAAQGLGPELYHLMRASTAVPLDTCVELIVVAARAHPGQPRKTASM